MKTAKTNFFGQFLLRQKFLLLGIIALILVALPFGFYLNSVQKNVAVAQNEINGIKPVQTLLKIIQLTQQHRELSASVLKSEATNLPALPAIEKDLNDTLSIMDAQLKEANSNSKVTESWAQANLNWQTLQDKLKKAKLPAAQSIKAHTDLIAKYFVLLDYLADFFELSLDPQEDSYFMMRAGLHLNPQLSEGLYNARMLGTEMLGLKETSPLQDAELPAIISVAQTHKNEALSMLQKTFDINATVKTKLEFLGRNALSQAEKAIQVADSEIIKKQMISYDKKAYYDIYSTAINSLAELNTQSIIQLKQIIEERKKQHTQEVLMISAGIIALLALGTLVSYFITRSVERPVGHLISVMQKLARGDNSVRANMQNLDEIGILGNQFDLMLNERELVSNKMQNENDTLNNSVIDLLQAVAKLAQKDLTVKVPVTEDITGPVADALNLLSSETAKVLNRVVQIAGDVSSVSQQIKSQSDVVINVAAEEQREVEKSVTELNIAAEAMNDIAELALFCNQAAEKAIQNTDKAQVSVLDTVQGITGIRDTIRETEKRIKRLGERSQEISSVITIINDIAERTHILALNASMHAASAGESGKGFAVVANEVQKLAKNARSATSQISSLVHNIQVETADTMTTMNDAITQVVQGTTLAQQAGNEMRDTRSTTAELVQLVQRIAESSKIQVETAQRLKDRALQIQKTTEHTFHELQDQGVQTDRLVDYAGNLAKSVGVFVLPKA